MNILIPYPWLLEYLETTATPDQLREFLSLSGPSVERVEILEGEPVLDIEITSNRVDSLSIMGIAREAATILPEYQIPASCQQIQVLPLTSWKTPAHSLPLPTIEN